MVRRWLQLLWTCWRSVWGNSNRLIKGRVEGGLFNLYYWEWNGLFKFKFHSPPIHSHPMLYSPAILGHLLNMLPSYRFDPSKRMSAKAALEHHYFRFKIINFFKQKNIGKCQSFLQNRNTQYLVQRPRQEHAACQAWTVWTSCLSRAARFDGYLLMRISVGYLLMRISVNSFHTFLDLNIYFCPCKLFPVLITTLPTLLDC